VTALPTPTVQPTAYRVSLLPEDDVNRQGRWAVTNGDACLGADGTWADGVKPHGRGASWLTAHRFDLDTALRLAQAAAPKVTVNGRTAADAYRLAVGEAS
jgi:hypothetical protein